MCACRDGCLCLFCKKEDDLDNFILEHLNGKPTVNEDWNHALSCQSCNIKKLTTGELQVIAHEKIKENKLSDFKYIEDKSNISNSPEIDHNQNVGELCHKIMLERTTNGEKVEYKEAKNGLAFICKEKFDHCSPITITRHLDMMASSFTNTPFMIIKEDGKRYITRRTGN